MPNADGTANVSDALKQIGVALAGALVIYLTGEYLPGIFLFIIPALVCGVGGYLAAQGDSKKKAAIGWGAIGMAAGILFYFAL